MKINNKGYVAIDMTIAIVGIIVFSGLIISLMYNNFLGNAKARKDALAIIYLTEIMENVAILPYDEIIGTNIENLKPIDLREGAELKDVYEVDININEEKNIEKDGVKTDFIKKVTATISYLIGNKKYSNSLERIIIKE